MLSEQASRNVLISMLVLITASTASATEPSLSYKCPPIKSSQTLVDSIGMNTHFMQGWQYEDYNRTIALLKDLGINQVREGFSGLGKVQLETAARSGLKFNFVIEPKWDGLLFEKLEIWHKKFPHSILAIEGPNEVNNSPVKIDGLTGIEAAKRFQTLIFRGIKSSSILKDIPVIALTSYPTFNNPADIGNIHVYSRTGGGILNEMDSAIKDEIDNNLDRKSIWITESGYQTLVSPGYYEGVSEDIQAKLILNLILNAINRGIEKVFVYQLLDQYDNHNDQEANFGLVARDWRPKPSFFALRNMIKLFTHAGISVGHRLKSLPYRLDGLPSTAAQATFQLSDSSWIIALWDNRRLWDEKNHRPAPSFASPITISLPQNDVTLSIYSPVANANALSVTKNESRFEFELSSSPIFLRVETEEVMPCIGE